MSGDHATPPQIAINRLELSGIEHLQQGALGAAEEDLSNALQQRAAQHEGDTEHESCVPAINNLAALRLKQNRYAEAAAGFRQVIAISSRMQSQASTPSTRTSLEIEAARRNLEAAERFMARDGIPIQPLPQPPPPASESGEVGYGWGALRKAKPDSLKKLGMSELQRMVKRLGGPTGGKKEDELAEMLRESLGSRSPSGDVDAEATRELVNMAFDLLDADGDGTLTRMEVLRGLKSNGEVQNLLKLPDKIGSSRDAFDAFYKAIDADGSSGISRAEFEAYFMRHLGGGGSRASSPDLKGARGGKPAGSPLASAALKLTAAGADARRRRESGESPPRDAGAAFELGYEAGAAAAGLAAERAEQP